MRVTGIVHATNRADFARAGNIKGKWPRWVTVIAICLLNRRKKINENVSFHFGGIIDMCRRFLWPPIQTDCGGNVDISGKICCKTVMYAVKIN
jgi:hypothetical protein